jgi:hypothetical protein
MAEVKAPFLCGGVIFFFMMEAVLPNGTAKDHIDGVKDEHPQPIVMQDLVTAVTGREYPKSEKDTSKYKDCLIEGSSNIPFNQIRVTEKYNGLVRKNYREALERMHTFVTAHLDPDMDAWLVKALLEIIENDDSIDENVSFLINADGSAMSKESISKERWFTIDSFLVGVLDFILQYRSGENYLGESTLDLYGEKKPRKQRVYTGKAGDVIKRTISADRWKPEVKSEVAPATEGQLEEKTCTPKKSNNEFKTYIRNATDYYSLKKTLLYPEEPQHFYDIYVCNDIRYHRTRLYGWHDIRPEKKISNADVDTLKNEARYIIIEGTGGIGKSMFLTHLYLSSAAKYIDTDELPVFLPLKDYRDDTASIVDFIWKTIRSFDKDVSQQSVVNALEEKKMILLMDGLDEIQSSSRDDFNTDLEAFIRSYPGNVVIMSSRPVLAFVSYTRFSLFDLMPLTKNQALDLIRKLKFWDEENKQDFMKALDERLYSSHYQFASNPLLLTIMLMSYSEFGEVPAKMHVFYSKAYETMARLHDATKGSYKRPLHTKLTPEEFAKYYAEFCARTYKDEVLEFDDRTFSGYMDQVLAKHPLQDSSITPRDFELDLTDNLCIMYREGDKLYFIHRSFQEYFTARYFSSVYDDRLGKAGIFFENMDHRSYSDRTFDMLYDMIPQKVERFIFLPFLDQKAEKYSKDGKGQEYWSFLEEEYPAIYCNYGETGEIYDNDPQSFLYGQILKTQGIGSEMNADELNWPQEISQMPDRNWVNAYRQFLEEGAFKEYPDPEKIPDELLEEFDLIPEDELPAEYNQYFGEPEAVGSTTEIEIYKLRKFPERYKELRRFMTDKDFPLAVEYEQVKKYHKDLKLQAEKERQSSDLFGD